MFTLRRILCAAGQPSASGAALEYAAALARTFGAELLNPDYAAGRPAPARSDGGEEARGRRNFPGAPENGEEVSRLAAALSADLIVLHAPRPHGDPTLLGPAVEAVCRTAPCPVLVSRGGGGRPAAARVLVAYDFSDDSEVALRYGLAFARQFGAELHLLHVLPGPASEGPYAALVRPGPAAVYEEAARRLRTAVPGLSRPGCAVSNAVLAGSPYAEVLSYAAGHGVGLVCMGARGADSNARSLFGSNTDRVLRQSQCPVLVARPLRPSPAAPARAWAGGSVSGERRAEVVRG